MGKYQTHRPDGNAKIIIEALNAGGAATAILGRPVDIAIAYRRRTHLAEIKAEDGKLRPSQIDFIFRWPAPVLIFKTIEDVQAFLRHPPL